MGIKRCGFFDSGLGGLSVARALAPYLEGDHFYFADSANLPFGAKSQQELLLITKRGIDHLRSMGAEKIIIACHTASICCSELIEDKDIIWISDTAPIIHKMDLGPTPLILGTERTIQSGFYQTIFSSPTRKIAALAAPELVRIIEHPSRSFHLSRIIIANLLGEYFFSPPSSILLCCTHFPLIANELRSIFGDKVQLIDPSSVMPELLNLPAPSFDSSCKLHIESTQNGKKIAELWHTLSKKPPISSVSSQSDSLASCKELL